MQQKLSIGYPNRCIVCVHLVDNPYWGLHTHTWRYGCKRVRLAIKKENGSFQKLQSDFVAEQEIRFRINKRTTMYKRGKTQKIQLYTD
jgi:hypothetical protein